MTAWAQDADPPVQRAAAAAICEPRLLVTAEGARAAREVCHTTTDLLVARRADRRGDPEVRVLRRALGYCWSVAVAAEPIAGASAFAELEAATDPDAQWIARANRKKARLRRVLGEA